MLVAMIQIITVLYMAPYKWLIASWLTVCDMNAPQFSYGSQPRFLIS